MSTSSSDQSDRDVSELNLSKQQLVQLHPNLFVNNYEIVKLKLNGNKLKRLPAHVFDCLKSLRYLNLKNNQLVDVDEAVSSLRQLHTLNLSFNRIRSLKRRHFAQMHELRVLRVTGNTLGQVSFHSFCHMENIRKLSLSQTNIGRLSAPLFDENSKLTHLSIEGAHLTISSGLFKPLTDLVYLNLNNNQFMDLAADTFDPLVNLRTLFLSNNNLRRLTEVWFGCNHALEYLDISMNSIELITPGFFQCLENLETLLMYGCSHSLQMDNNMFGQNDRLTTLSFSECLHFANRHLANLTKLCYDSKNVSDMEANRNILVVNLELANGDLLDLELKSTIVEHDHLAVINTRFVNLKTLTIHDSSLTMRQDRLLDNLLHLNKLDLSGCSLERFELALFADTNQLEELILNKCNLRVMVARAFTNLKRLKKLDLSQNFFMHQIDTNVFSGLRSLTELNLSGSYVRDLPPGLFEHNTNLEIVRLSGNCIMELNLRLFQRCTQLRQLYCWKYTNFQNDLARNNILILE